MLRGKKRVHAFGYNSAESEWIWMKSGAPRVRCLGLAQADFGCDLRSSNSLRGNRIFVFGHLNDARFHPFPFGNIS